MTINEQEVRKFVLAQLKRETEVLSVLWNEFPEDYEGYTPKDSVRDSFKTQIALMQEGESGSYGEKFYKRALEILMEEKEEKHDRGAFTGLSEEEIEEEYRKHYEGSKKHNGLDKKIVRETKFMINETKRDIQKYPLVNFAVYGLLLGMLLWSIFSSLH